MARSEETDNVRLLRQQLTSAEMKLREYTDIIISQANELRIMRDNLCQGCKKRFAPSPESSPSDAPLSALVHPRSSSSKPFSIERHSPTDTSFHSLILGNPEPRANSSTIDPRVSSKPRSMSTKTANLRPEHSFEYQTTQSRRIGVTLVRAFALQTDVMSVKFSPDGKYLAASMGNYAGKTVIFDVASTNEMCVIGEYSLEKIGIGYPCFTPGAQHLATAGTDNRIKLWEISQRRVRSIYRITGYIAALDISPNGRFLACASGQNVILWHIRDGSKKVFSDRTSNKYSFIKFSLNGLYIATVDSHDTLRLWNVRTGHLVARWTRYEEHAQVKGLWGRYHNSLRFWTVGSPGESNEGREKKVLLFTGHTTSIYSNVSVSPDGRWVISSSQDVNVHIRDARDSLQQFSFRRHAKGISVVSFSPMGRYFAVGDGKHVSLWSYKPRANSLQSLSDPLLLLRH